MFVNFYDAIKMKAVGLEIAKRKFSAVLGLMQLTNQLLDLDVKILTRR
jgi:hypothetical protein